MIASHRTPADSLDELHALRVAGKAISVDKLAESVWHAARSGDFSARTGLGGVAQAAFVAAQSLWDEQNPPAEPDLRRVALRAPLWQARAVSAAAELGELNTVAMLLLPFAFKANSVGSPESALAVMDEIDALVGVWTSERPGSEASSGVPVATLKRSVHEKRGFFLWRRGDYTDSLASYEEAVAVSPAESRDLARAQFGLLLATLGLMEQAGDAQWRDQGVEEFASLAARAGNWNDVSQPAGWNAENANDPKAVPTVQDLHHCEIE